MSAKDNNSEVAVEKVSDNDKSITEAKAEVKGNKRPSEVSKI